MEDGNLRPPCCHVTDCMEKTHFYNLSLAGVPVRLSSFYPHVSFEEACTKEAPAAFAALSPGAIEAARSKYPAELTDPDIEYTELAAAVGTALLPQNRCVFHGAAFLWQEKAWIFTAPSGTGKTTQYALWKSIYGPELTIINGDKPILAFGEDGSVTVHNSPWRGKEHMGQPISAPLGGIIYLQQADENRIQRLSARDSILPVLSQILCDKEDPQTTLLACDATEKIIQAAPVWYLANRGDKESAALAHDTLLCSAASLE